MALYLGNKLVAGGSTGLEIGDMGFAPLGIDETQNKRRYLNGQVISQAQFSVFTNKIKERAKLYPNLITTEENWQAEVTNSKLGQCGKFVIDDTLGTIRLPKVINIQGLQDLALMGSIVEAGLPNIEGKEASGRGDNITGSSGAFSQETNTSGNELMLYYNTTTSTSNKQQIFDASLSNPIYGNSETVQQEAIQYPYFIQVATGVEESVNVTREIELNNPFSLLDYKWSEYELNNASWLISNGTFHSGATYVAVYELLLKLHNGTETKEGVSVKLSTEEYTDTDFVINTADTTFRLPIKVKLASGNAVVGNGMTLGMTDGTNNYGMSGWLNVSGSRLKDGVYGSNVGTAPSADMSGNSLGVTTDPEYSGIETSSSGLKLYFYVGETIQDANVIAASQVLTDVTNLKAHSIVETYVNGTSWYRVWSDGWCEQGGVQDSGQNVFTSFLKAFNSTNYTLVAEPLGQRGQVQEISPMLYGKTTNGFYSFYGDTYYSINWIATGYIS